MAQSRFLKITEMHIFLKKKKKVAGFNVVYGALGWKNKQARDVNRRHRWLIL